MFSIPRGLIGITGAVVLLNGVLALFGAWHPACIFSSAGLILSIWPMTAYLRDPGDSLPFFPMICLIYGIYYFLFGLIPFEPYHTVAGVSEQGLFKASILAFLGLLSLQVGYWVAIRSHRRDVSRQRMDFSPSAASGMMLLGVLGLAGWLLGFTRWVPLAFQSLFTLIGELLVFAFAGLFYLQLKGKVRPLYRVVNWGLFFPAIVFTSLATSLLYPLIRIVLLAFLVFIYVRKRIPWKPLALVVVLFIPLFILKIGFRQIEAASNKEKFSGVTQMIQRVKVYGEVVQALGGPLGEGIMTAAYNTTASRFDLSHTFAFIIEETPAPVPYLHGRSYTGLFWKLIPRAIYPQKPIESWGNELGHRFGWLAPDDDDTSVNMPQLVEWYLNFGGWGVPLGMLLIGLLYGGLIRLLHSNLAPAQGLVSLFLLSSLFNVESNFSLVFGGLPYSLVIFLGLFRLVFDRSLSPEEC